MSPPTRSSGLLENEPMAPQVQPISPYAQASSFELMHPQQSPIMEKCGHWSMSPVKSPMAMSRSQTQVSLTVLIQFNVTVS